MERRSFLKSAAATAAVVSSPSILNAQGIDQRTLKVGLIGCGGRGTGALFNALNADDNVTLWALADTFEDAVKSTFDRASKKFAGKVDVAERKFVGLDAFKKLIDSGVDVVLLGAPPAFRPEHLRAAIEGGKHVFAEKPMAVDVAGVKHVLESAKLAKEKNVAIQHGYCWRFDPKVRDAYGRILSGEWGPVRSVYGTYMSTPPKPHAPDSARPAGMGDYEWQIRNWTNYDYLSGCPILEQAIHTVDKVAWAMGDVAPIAATATGGRTQRTDQSNVWDNYNINYEYPGQVFCQAVSRQWTGGYSGVTDRVFCEKATVVAPSRVFAFDQSGKGIWRSKAKGGNMYDVCHQEFFASLRKGEIINTGEYMANSTMLGILGREAAHSGKRVTWDELWKSDQDLAPDDMEFSSSFTPSPVPVPGKYEIG